MKNNTSSFRLWVANIWRDNLEERLTYNEEPLPIKEYWDKYKWWLKREYLYQTRKNKQ